MFRFLAPECKLGGLYLRATSRPHCRWLSSKPFGGHNKPSQRQDFKTLTDRSQARVKNVGPIIPWNRTEPGKPRSSDRLNIKGRAIKDIFSDPVKPTAQPMLKRDSIKNRVFSYQGPPPASKETEIKSILDMYGTPKVQQPRGRSNIFDNQSGHLANLRVAARSSMGHAPSLRGSAAPILSRPGELEQLERNNKKRTLWGRLESRRLEARQSRLSNKAGFKGALNKSSTQSVNALSQHNARQRGMIHQKEEQKSAQELADEKEAADMQRDHAAWLEDVYANMPEHLQDDSSEEVNEPWMKALDDAIEKNGSATSIEDGIDWNDELDEETIKKLKPSSNLQDLFGETTPEKSPSQHKRTKPIRIGRMQTIRYMSKLLGKTQDALIKLLEEVGDRTDLHPLAYIDHVEAELLANHYDVPYKLPQVHKLTRVLSGTSCTRAPVVCVMGHVDHGKTTLLDTLRKGSVAAREAGGITQSIASFAVPFEDLGLQQTHSIFIDTPGHAAFHSMRSRGVSKACSDICVLVIDVNEGLKPQTIESIELAQQAGVQLVVALNKCDIHGCDPEAVRHALMAHDVVCEEMGGDIPSSEISALTGMGLDNLKENIALAAELMELTADPKAGAQCFVLETSFKRGLGHCLDVVVRDGELKVGDYFVCGEAWGKVRRLMDLDGKSVKSVGPSESCTISGIDSINGASTDIIVTTAKEAKETAELRRREANMKELLAEAPINEKLTAKAIYAAPRPVGGGAWVQPKIPLVTKARVQIAADRLAEKMAPKTQEVNLVYKCDSMGSVEALTTFIKELPPIENVEVTIIKSGIGPITDNDIKAASSTKGHLFAFNVASPNKKLEKQAHLAKVDIIQTKVIYEIFDKIKDALSATLPPVDVPVVHGRADVGMLFEVNMKDHGKVITLGSKMKSGEISKKDKHMVRVLRGMEEETIWEGEILSLRFMKDDINSVKTGEFGIVLKGCTADTVQPGDIIESYSISQEPQDFDSAFPDHGFAQFTKKALNKSRGPPQSQGDKGGKKKKQKKNNKKKGRR